MFRWLLFLFIIVTGCKSDPPCKEYHCLNHYQRHFKCMDEIRITPEMEKNIKECMRNTGNYCIDEFKRLECAKKGYGF